MARSMQYLAQPYWRRDGGLVPGEPLPFLCAVDAEEGGALLAKSAAGVVAYQQVIDRDASIFEEPEILATWGDLPASAVCIDGDGWDDEAA